MTDWLDDKIRSTVVELVESSPEPHSAHQALRPASGVTSRLRVRSGLARAGAAAVVVLMVGLGAGWLAGRTAPTDELPPQHANSARTYFESLDLTSPLAAVDLFVDAYAADDFFTVWLVLGPAAQLEIKAVLTFRDFDRIIDTSQFEDLEQVYQDEIADLDQLESFDIWYTFDQLMMAADTRDALLFDFTGNEEANQIAPGEFTVTVAGLGELSIQVQERSNRWRITAVGLPATTGEVTYWPGEPSDILN